MLDPDLDTFPKLALRNAQRLRRNVAIREKDLGIWQSHTWSQYVEQARLIDRAARDTADGLRSLRGLKQEPLRAFLISINEIENQGDRLYRRARADLYNFTGEHPARYVLIWKDIVEQLEEALDGFEHVAHTVETILIKHA